MGNVTEQALLDECRHICKFSLTPHFKGVWDKSRGHPYVSALPEILLNTEREIAAARRDPTLPHFRCSFQADSYAEETDAVTPRRFLMLLYGIASPDSWSDKDLPPQIALAIDKAEAGLLKHIRRIDGFRLSPLHSYGAFLLRRSSIRSTRTDRHGKIPKSAREALFTLREYLTELEAAEVPKFWYRYPEEDDAENIVRLYRRLPNSVKESFFAFNALGEPNQSLPCYLLRDLILFADDEKWNALKSAASAGKPEGREVFSVFLTEFLQWERRENRFRLGASPRNTTDPAYLSPKALAYLELIKPADWVGKMNSSTDEEDCG